MERYKKKDMLHTVDMLLKANDAILRTVSSNPQGAAEALAQCQESAIVLGTYLDTLGEKYADLVHTLEDYCENIYQMNESLSDENLCRKYSKKIQKQLTGLRNGIKYDLPDDKKEVVFLPYKASMWDSLESVWKAAAEDPNCDAYVIPIPYFDKNPDGSFKEEHYEGDQYPKNVPITRYDEYDLETRRPDVIYIHNPYDECNHVTSVHPYFYSKNLRNFTDKLVYIPYFVLSEIEPDNQAAIDGMKHFCFTPGTIYANQVIVQSENMRQIYINEYMKAAKEMGLGGEHVDRKFLEKKFLGTGSPKFDKVQNTKREDLEIPAEWLRIIRKPDGSWKKIIFYNTSVSALLQYSEKMLKKMESVFGIFKENQDEVALLWRPHPLIQATIESMRPQLWEAYKAIRDRYIEEGWGIYDDSADMDRAVVVSDAYYGDGSSVVHLCQKKGMPVMVQNVNSISENNYSLAMNNIVEYEREWWFLGLKDNCLYKMNKNSFNVTLVKRIYPGEKENNKNPLYASICVRRGKIFLIPWSAKQIAIYDIRKDEVRYIEYDAEKSYRGQTFADYYIWKEKLYLIPCAYPFLLCIDMEKEKILQTIEVKNTGTNVQNRDVYAWGSIYIDYPYIYFTEITGNGIYEFNMENNVCKRYEVNFMKNGGGICGDEKNVWIIPLHTDRILRWSKQNQTLSVCDNFPDDYQSGKEWSFHKLYGDDRSLYLLPRESNMCLAMDKETGVMRAINLNEKHRDYDNFYDCKMPYSNIWRDGHKLYLISSRRGEIYVVEKDNVTEIKKITLLSELQFMYNNMQIIYEQENRFENLQNLIEIIK